MIPSHGRVGGPELLRENARYLDALLAEEEPDIGRRPVAFLPGNPHEQRCPCPGAVAHPYDGAPRKEGTAGPGNYFRPGHLSYPEPAVPTLPNHPPSLTFRWPPPKSSDTSFMACSLHKIGFLTPEGAGTRSHPDATMPSKKSCVPALAILLLLSAGCDKGGPRLPLETPFEGSVHGVVSSESAQPPRV